MSDRPQKAWHPDVRYITFSFADGRITVFKSALEDLHWPAFYRFLYNHPRSSLRFRHAKIGIEVRGSHIYPQNQRCGIQQLPSSPKPEVKVPQHAKRRGKGRNRPHLPFDIRILQEHKEKD